MTELPLVKAAARQKEMDDSDAKERLDGEPSVTMNPEAGHPQ
jgi:hypothetical protein